MRKTVIEITDGAARRVYLLAKMRGAWEKEIVS
jgi:hypothetical protein